MAGVTTPNIPYTLTKTHKHAHVSAAITNTEASPIYFLKQRIYAVFVLCMVADYIFAVSNVYVCPETKTGFPECSCYW